MSKSTKWRLQSDSSFTIVNFKEKQRNVTFKKLETAVDYQNGWQILSVDHPRAALVVSVGFHSR